MGGMSITHWLIVLVIVVLVFGTKKLANLGKDLGSAVKGFKDGMKEGAAEDKPLEPGAQVGHTIEGEATAVKNTSKSV